jgi:hypothetical protein
MSKILCNGNEVVVDRTDLNPKYLPAQRRLGEFRRNPGEASRRDQFETISNDQISNVQENKRLGNLNFENSNLPALLNTCRVIFWFDSSRGPRKV